MARSRTLSSDSARTRPAAWSALAGALPLVALAIAGCDSGTQEPAAPEAEGVEYSAPAPPSNTARPSTAAPGDLKALAARRLPELPDKATRSIPDNFPSDMPVYPGAEPAIGMGAAIGSGARSGVQLVAGDSPEKVRDYYTSELAAKGWEITDTGDNAGTGYTITAKNGDSTTIFFISPSAEGGADVLQIVEQN